MIRLMLDTNICIYILKKQTISVLRELQQYKMGEVGISMIVYGELIYNAYKSSKKIENLTKIEALMDSLETLVIDEPVIHHYGELRVMLEQKGQTIGANDFWIAAHALALDIPLVTNNTKEFIKIPELNLLNWM